MTSLAQDATLEEAKTWLREQVGDGGAKCPCCTQFAKVYRRKINSTMARTLITMYRHGARAEFVHGPSLPGDTHEISQLSWWGLAEEERVYREDGGRAGWWRMTPKGYAFVVEAVQVQKYALIYDGRCLGLDGENVSLREALGSRFNYSELMSA